VFRWVRDFEGGLLMMADMSASGVGRGERERESERASER